MSAFTPLHQRDHFVYRVYDSTGTLLYVGCAYDVDRRIREHRRNQQPWVGDVGRVVVDGPYHRSVARKVELAAQRQGLPQYGLPVRHKLGRVQDRYAVIDPSIIVHCMRHCDRGHGRSGREVARLTGVSNTLVSLLRSGQRTTLPREQAERFAAAIGCSLLNIFEPVGTRGASA